MKPMVVSAAAAGRAPSAEPSVSAALPCNRRRREILLKSIDYSPWRVIPLPNSLAAPVRWGLKSHVASFMPELCDSHLVVIAGETLEAGYCPNSDVIKFAADLANCMR